MLVSAAIARWMRVVPAFGILVLPPGLLAQPPATASATPSADSLPATVRRVTAAARVGDPSLRALRAALFAAEGRARSAGLAPPVAVALALSDGPRGDVLAGNAVVELSRELFRGARNDAARAREAASVEAARTELASAERVLEVRVLSAFARAAGAARIADRLARSDRWLADAESALRARFAAGDARYVDVLRVRTERLQAAAERSRMLAEHTASLATLVGIVGAALPPDTLALLVGSASEDSATREWRAVLVDGPDEDALVAGFPAVRAARAAEQGAHANRAGVAASHRPQVVGVVGVQQIGSANGGPTAGFLLGLSSTLPFTARIAQTRGLEAAAAEILFAEASRREAESAARASVRAASARYAAARGRLDGFDTALLLAADAEREAALSEYRAGTLLLMELLDFERALLRVEVERTRALIDATLARGDLFGLASPDLGAKP